MLDVLATFLAVYREGSIRAGARLAGLSQPAASAQVRTLERTLGTALFDRGAAGVVPTAAADALARDVGESLDRLRSAADWWLRDGGPPSRPFRLAGPADLLAERVVADLAPLVAEGVRLDLETGLTEDLVERLTRGAVDAVVALRRPRERGLAAVTLTDEQLVLVARPGPAGPAPTGLAAAGAGPGDDARRLAALPLLAFDDSLPLFRRYWRVAFGRRPEGTPVLVVPDLRALRRACLAGTGATVLPTYLVADDLAQGRLVELHRHPDGVINTIWFVTRQRSSPHPDEDPVRRRLTESARMW
ncbi:MAG: LysR family transcriptional regulator [Kineosporiaceae bacterium]